MLEEKNNHEQDSTDQELDDLLKDFREQDDLHARIQQFKRRYRFHSRSSSQRNQPRPLRWIS